MYAVMDDSTSQIFLITILEKKNVTKKGLL